MAEYAWCQRSDAPFTMMYALFLPNLSRILEIFPTE